MPMFKVIELEDSGDGGGLSFVREQWLTPRKKECFWPPYKLTSKFNKCLTTSTLVPDEKWPVYRIKRILYETDDLMKAREKCKKAGSKSELATTDLEGGETRKRKRKIRTLQSCEEESDENHINVTYPKPPNKNLFRNDQTSNHGSRASTPGAIIDSDIDLSTFSPKASISRSFVQEIDIGKTYYFLPYIILH